MLWRPGARENEAFSGKRAPGLPTRPDSAISAARNAGIFRPGERTAMAKVEIYSTMFCPYCARARALLQRKGIAFTEIDLLEEPGGCDDMVALDRAGQLDPKLGLGQ